MTHLKKYPSLRLRVFPERVLRLCIGARNVLNLVLSLVHQQQRVMSQLAQSKKLAFVASASDVI